MQTIKQKNNQTISKNLFELLTKKVVKVNKKSILITLKKEEIKDITGLDVIMGVYSCKSEDGNTLFTVYKIFVVSDALVKGSYNEYNLISNALLQKNKDKKVSNKINIYNNQNNEKYLNTFIEFLKSKTNTDDIKPGEYILQGLKLGDLLEIEI